MAADEEESDTGMEPGFAVSRGPLHGGRTALSRHKSTDHLRGSEPVVDILQNE